MHTDTFNGSKFYTFAFSTLDLCIEQAAQRIARGYRVTSVRPDRICLAYRGKHVEFTTQA